MRTYLVATSALTWALCAMPAAGMSAPAAAPHIRAAICGLGDDLFCGPLSIVAADARASTHYWWTWSNTAEAIAAKHPRSVTLIAHSQGCKSAIRIAARLNDYKIRVRRLACFDGVPFTPAVPANVRLAKSWRKPFLPGGGVMCRGEKNCSEITYRFGGVTHMQVPIVARRDALAFIAFSKTQKRKP